MNHGSDELVLYAYGYPPEDEHAELLDSAAEDGDFYGCLARRVVGFGTRDRLGA